MELFQRSVICFVLMVTVAPLAAVAVLSFLQAEHWYLGLNPLAILVMYVFGLFTVPLWPTYFPAVVITPVIMGWIGSWRAFQKARMWLLYVISVVIGAGAGLLVMIPLVRIEWTESPKSALNFSIAGAVAGAITLCVTVLAFRRKQRL